MSKKQLVDLWFTNQIAPKSALFGAGKLGDAPSDESFVLRLNTLVAASARNINIHPPKDLRAAISAKGKLDEHAELVVFGNWLLRDSMPGLPARGGPQVDRPRLLRCVAAALVEYRTQSATTEAANAEPAGSTRISKNDLTRSWNKLFGEDLKPSAFDSRMRSMRRILPAYLDYLKSGSVTHAGKTIRKSPQILEVLEAISGAKSASSSATGPVGAVSLPIREQMVGLLQRHHWASHEILIGDDPDTPAHADARQIYPGIARPRNLFAREPKEKNDSDAHVRRDAVRRRVFDAKPGNDLYLDATFYKGIQFSPFLVSIQHKIADRRNPNGNTRHILHRKDRRARIEVTITGSDALMKRGVALIDDLAGVSFRQMKKSLLQFRLGTLEPQQHLLDDAKEQMSSRGVYGMEMKERARHQEERQQMRRSGQKMTRNRDREGLGLVDWQEMNTITGNALDDLSRRWRGFSWTGKGKA